MAWPVRRQMAPIIDHAQQAATGELDLGQEVAHQRFLHRLVHEMDAQQRVSMPKRLREFASIESKVTIVGMIDHIEFWQPEEFDKYLSGQAESYEDVAAKVMTI